MSIFSVLYLKLPLLPNWKNSLVKPLERNLLGLIPYEDFPSLFILLHDWKWKSDLFCTVVCETVMVSVGVSSWGQGLGYKADCLWGLVLLFSTVQRKKNHWEAPGRHKLLSKPCPVIISLFHFFHASASIPSQNFSSLLAISSFRIIQ